MKYLLSILMFILTFSGIYAQIKLQTFVDVGSNNVSEGVYVKNAYRISYQYQKYKIEAGMQFDILSNSPNTITGIDVIGAREFFNKYFPIDVKGFFILNRFSDLFYETNWGLRIETKKFERFTIEFGLNFKTYTINSAARKEYNISKSNSKLSENFNLTYILTAFLMPHGNDWNVGISITNVDYYMVNQLTNPVYNLQMRYSPISNLTMNMDVWYKQAGILNINANYFGYFIRGGVKWVI